MLEKKIITRLIEIVGEAGLKEGEAVEGYSIDGLLPRTVLFPRTPEEVEQIVILALEEGSTIIPWGAGTQMGLGALPSHVDFLVCLRSISILTPFVACQSFLVLGCIYVFAPHSIPLC